MDFMSIAKEFGIPAVGLAAMFFYVVLPLRDRHLKFLDKIELTIDKITETQDKIVDSQNIIVGEIERISGVIASPVNCKHVNQEKA